MFIKTVATVLFSISAVLGYHIIQNTPEELKELFQNIDTQVKDLEHETKIQIRTNTIPLAMYPEQARTAIIDNITSAGEPYWAAIKSLEETAAQQGQNISDCVDLGNNQLYTLNDTIVSTAYEKIDSYEQAGNDILNSSAIEANSVIDELIILEQLVEACNDDICATELTKTVTQYHARAKAALIDAEVKARNYVLVYLPVLLAAAGLDSDSYVANYTVFLKDVTDCIDKL